MTRLAKKMFQFFLLVQLRVLENGHERMYYVFENLKKVDESMQMLFLIIFKHTIELAKDGVVQECVD